MNILITNVGRRGYLVRYLKEIEWFNGKVFVSDCDCTASGLYGENDGHFIMPRPVDDEKKYIDKLLELCIEKEISIVLPVIDPEIYILSNYIELFAKHNIILFVSSKRVLDICYNKLLMNEFLRHNNLCVPNTYESIEVFLQDYNENKVCLPVVIKPIYGSGSQSTYKAETLEEVKTYFKEGLIIQEYLDGKEYGIDIFNNFEGVPVRCIVKMKIAMRSGETDKAISVKNVKIKELMNKVATYLGHIGNLDADILQVDDDYYVIDLNPRFGGGYPITHEIGVNLLELVLKMKCGEKINPEFDNYEENILVMKEIGVTKTIMEE